MPITQTGIEGLDEILGGGIPTGRTVLILGEPGAGKSILCSSFLANGYEKFGEHGVYVSLEENKPHLFTEMAKFNIDFALAESRGQFEFIDASPIRYIPDIVQTGGSSISRGDFSLVALIDTIKKAVEKLGAKRLVIDPLSYLMFQFVDPAQLRGALLDLVGGLGEIGTTTLMTAELHKTGSVAGRDIQMEEYVAHGTIVMQSVQSGNSIVRSIQVQKMRESKADRQPRPYLVTDTGISVFPNETVF